MTPPSSPPNSSKPTTAEIVGGVFNAAGETLVDGQATPLQTDANGNLLVKLAGSGAGATNVNIADVSGNPPALTNPLPVELSDGTQAVGTVSNPITVSEPSIAVVGATAPASATLAGGSDGAILRALQTDSTGRLNVNSFAQPTQLPTFIQGGGTGAGVTTFTYTNPVGLGNLLIVVARGSGGAITITDTLGNLWQRAGTSMLYYTFTKAGANTLTYSAGTQTAVGEYSGVANVPPDAFTPTATLGSQPPPSFTLTTATITPTANFDLLIGTAWDDNNNGDTYTWGAGWSVTREQSNAAFADKIQVTAAPVALSVTFLSPSTIFPNASLVAFKANVAQSVNQGLGQTTPQFAWPVLQTDVTDATLNNNVFLRTPNKFKTVQATASGDTALWTPTAGKKFRLMRYMIEVTGNATLAAGAVLTVVLRDATTALPFAVDVFVPTTAFSAGVDFVSPWFDLDNGVLSAAANNVLNVNLSAALTAGNVRVLCCGTEE